MADKVIEKIKKICLFGSLFLIFLYDSLIYKIPLYILKINYNDLNYNIQSLLSIGSSLIMILILFLIYRKYLKEKWLDFRKNYKNYIDLNFKYWFLGLVGMCIFNILIAKISPIKEANNEVLVQQMLRQTPLLCFISATILAPLQEEMIFRKSLSDIFKNKAIKVIMCGLVFGLLHVIFSIKTPWDLLYILPYGVLGSAFAYMLTKKDNIFIPISFHMLHNGLITLISILKLVLFR